MNTSDLRARRSEHRAAEDRSHPDAPQTRRGVIVLGVSLAIVGAMTAVASSPDHLAFVVLGIGLLVSGAAIGLVPASTLRRTSPGAAPRSDLAPSEDESEHAVTPSSFHGSLASMQLGPDSEQVIARRTGART
jgi:hypothetical protein